MLDLVMCPLQITTVSLLVYGMVFDLLIGLPMLNLILERSLASVSSTLPVLTPGSACHHIFILLPILRPLNINLKLNFLSKHLTTDSEHFISAPG